MTALTIELELPDPLVDEVRDAGLLSPEAIEAMLRERLRSRHVDELLETADRLAAVEMPSISEAEVQGEVDAFRAERRARRS